jgi:epoxyqueuosine reductase
LAVGSPRAGPELTAWVKSSALSLGFDVVGIAAAGPAPGAAFFEEARGRGYLDPLPYLHQRVPARLDPRRLHAGARSVIVVGMGHAQEPPPPPLTPHLKVARYAARRDYHLPVTKLLRKLRKLMRARLPAADGYVSADTGAVLERGWAQEAGLGWVGKSGMLLSRELGSCLVLGVLVTTVELEPDPPGADLCGTCDACLRGCPTGAIVAPRLVDARRCIATWTVEWRDTLFPPGVPPFHGWGFGCDACQEACPYLRRGRLNRLLRPRADLWFLDMAALCGGGGAVLPPLEGTPLARAGVKRLARNARWGTGQDIDP